MNFSCEARILSGKNQGNYCGKKAKFHIQIKSNKIHLCEYHNTRYEKQQRIVIHMEENMEITEYGYGASIEKRREIDYLPSDCWSVILNILPEHSKLLCKFVCKHWNFLLKDQKTTKIDFGYEYTLYGYKNINYFHELAIAYGIHNICVDNIGCDEEIIWFLNKGAKFTELALASAVVDGSYDVVDLLIKKGYKYTNYNSIHVSFVKKPIRELLINNNIVKLDGCYLISV
jgi:hypothetical protein